LVQEHGLTYDSQVTFEITINNSELFCAGQRAIYWELFQKSCTESAHLIKTLLHRTAMVKFSYLQLWYMFKEGLPHLILSIEFICLLPSEHLQ
jgi:hypothetical protein